MKSNLTALVSSLITSSVNKRKTSFNLLTFTFLVEHLANLEWQKNL
jgi:hypothetical protein